jgi:hypothetical protein
MGDLTDRTFDTAAISILSEGLNLSQSSNLKDFVSGTESTIQHLPLEIAEAVR